MATVPQIFDLLADPQERYDVLMNGFTENTWAAVLMGQEVKKLMVSYLTYPPRKMQAESYSCPISITKYQQFEWVREQLKKDGFNLSLPGQ